MMITDAKAVQQAQSCAPDSVVSVEIGAGDLGAYNERVRVDAEVVRHLDGAFTYTGPFAGGVTANMGDTSVLRLGELRIVLHASPVMEIDPSPLIHAGMDQRRTRIMQAKSHVSFRAGYEGIARSFVVADTLGPTTMTLANLPYHRRPRPLYPFEQDFDLPPMTFH